MLFNSLSFWFFFLCVFGIYRLLNPQSQKIWLLLSSYVFYCSWDYRFLFLLWLSTSVDYLCALFLTKTDSRPKRRIFLCLSLTVNLLILGFFKYCNFFLENAYSFLKFLGASAAAPSLQIILPIGISFYTFQAMGYVIDVYRKETPAEKNWINYALYVSFFPQLISGPIEKAKRLLPQLKQRRPLTRETFSMALGLILWGLFKKIVVADNVGAWVHPIFVTPAVYPGYFSLLASYGFAIQIYGDFSGYTDIARGLAYLFGVELRLNFDKPYLAKTPSEFWKRWHMSLSTWLKDYLYISLGGNRGGHWMTCRNLMITMLLGGLWHGAAWKYVGWGFYQGVLLVAERVHREKRKPQASSTLSPDSAFASYLKIAGMFHLTCLGWILFQAPTLKLAGTMVSQILFHFDFSGCLRWIFYSPLTVISTVSVLGTTIFYLVNHRDPESPRWKISHLWPPVRFALYACMGVIFFYGANAKVHQFIYFQF